MHRRPWLFPLVFVLAVAAHLPSLGAGFYADDYLHQLVLGGEFEGVHTTPFNLFDFGTDEDWSAVDGAVGSFPWWTSPGWSARFFRPLTSATLWLDHALYGSEAVGYHLTSLVWYAVLLALVLALYRGLGLSGGTLLLAFVFFAGTNGGLVPVGWPANRNSLIEATFVVAAVLATLRLAPDRRWGPLGVALGCGALACMAKESGVVAFPLVALRLVQSAARQEDAGFRRWARGAAVLCTALPVGYLASLALLGFGTNSAFYATPWHEPGAYLSNLAQLWTAGVLRLVVPFPLDLLGWRPSIAPLAVLPAAALLAPLVVLFWKRRSDLAHASLLVPWVVLALGVQGAPPVSDRLLLTAAVASAPLLARFVAATWRSARRPERWAARGILVSAGIVAVLFMPLQGLAFAQMANDTRRAVLEADVGSPELGTRDVVVLQAASSTVPFVIASTWGIERPDDLDLHFWLLQTGRRGLEWRREDERTFTLKSRDLPFFELMFERVYLTRDDAVDEGRAWSCGLFEVEAVEVDERGLRTLRVHFSRSPDDPRVRFLVDRDGRLTAIAPPAVGETLLVDEAVSTTPFMP